MGTGFVVSLPESEVESFVDAAGGMVIGRVEAGDSVEIRGLSLS